MESLYRTILSMVENYLGRTQSQYFPLIFIIFHFILFSTSTVEFVISLSIAFTLLIGILIIGFINHQFYLFAVFIPAGTPLSLIPL